MPPATTFEPGTSVRAAFCKECNNLLYPFEDAQSRTLQYRCRHCRVVEDSRSPCVYQNIITLDPMDKTTVVKDLASDPTYPRAKKTCPKCSHTEAVFFQSRTRNDTSMKLFFACTNGSCGHRWIE